MSSQHFFIGDRYLGARTIPDYASIGGEGVRVNNSYLLVCTHPDCAQVWAKLMHDHPQAYAQPVSSCCPKHATFPHEGRLSTEYGNRYADYEPRGLEEDWPRAALLFEVQQLCTQLLKKEGKLNDKQFDRENLGLVRSGGADARGAGTVRAQGSAVYRLAVGRAS